MSEPGLEDITKAGLAVAEWSLPRIKNIFKKFNDKERIELILNKIIINNYTVSPEIRELMKDNYGDYESSWGCVLKALEQYPSRCKFVLKQAIKRKWIKLNPKARCKVRIKKIDKIDDAKWGFTTIKRPPLKAERQHSDIIVNGKTFEIYHEPDCPKNEIWLRLETLNSNEELYGVFSWHNIINNKYV